MARLAAALAALSSLPSLRAETCPDMEPYTPEASPFGWPVTPKFSYDKQDCWAKDYPFCAGTAQSPLDINLADTSGRCETTSAGDDGALKDAATYWGNSDVSQADWVAAGLGPKPVIKVSPYMRTIMTEGPFGKLNLKDASGHDVEYEATQVHITPESMHTIDGSRYDAEMLVMHRPKGAKDLLSGSVIVSVLFTVGNTSSPVFESFGANLMKGSEWAVDAFGVKDTLTPALAGPAYQYNGSVPVPPCAETVTWMVLGKVQPISQEHLKNLKDVVSKHAGGAAKRFPVQRRVDGSGCRKIVKNGLQVSPAHEQATCAALTTEKFPTGKNVRCGEDMMQCEVNPALSTTANVVTGTATSMATMMHYTSQDHVVVVPEALSLKAHVPHGSFGHLMLNGRPYVASRLAIKPMSAHSFNGHRYAGELIIVHEAYGKGEAAEGGQSTGHSEDASHGADHSAGGHDAGHGTGHGASHRRLGALMADNEVWVSVPLRLGEESPLLRNLGLGHAAFQRAISDGHEYAVPEAIDLKQELAPVLSGNWYWYTAGQNDHSCTSHGRWITFETPLEISFAQLNDIALPVSGMDSTWISAAAPAKLYKNMVPPHAVEAPTAGHGVCQQPWSYQNTHCWAANFTRCSGSRQSPINLQAADVQQTGNDNFLSKCSWKPVKAVDVENSGKGLQVVNNQLGYFAYIDEEGNQAYYQVTGVKLHMPSEHMVDNKPYDAELQVVHQKQRAVNDLMKDDLAITSFLFRIGDEESPLLKQLHLPGHKIEEDAPTKMAQPLDLMRAFGPAMDGSYYRYDGSLTVPDCSESVKWWVFDTPHTMSKEQADAFKAMFPGSGNNRPIQELNGRTIVKNSFMQGTLKEYGFYLNRKGGRSRSDWNRSETLILIPIIFTVFFTIYVWSSLFVREDKVRLASSAGGISSGTGMENTIGRPQPYSRF